MDQPESYSLEAYRFPLSLEEHKEITGMLRERRVFAPSFVPQHDPDVYDPLSTDVKLFNSMPRRSFLLIAVLFEQPVTPL